MQYFYVVMWVAVGLILIFGLGKEHKVFYFAGGFFLLLGGWWLADALMPENLFDGAWGTALRLVTLAALVVSSVVFFIERQRMINKEVAEKKKAAKAAPQEEEVVDTMNAMPSQDGIMPPLDGIMPPQDSESLRASTVGVNIMRPLVDPEEEQDQPEE